MNINNLFQLARKSHIEGNLLQAESLYKKILKVQPHNVGAYFELGNVYHDSDQFDKAIACYQKVIKFDPKFAGSYNNLGNIFRTKGQLDEAIIYYRKVIERDPNFHGVYYNYAQALDSRGFFEEAIYYYKKSIEYLPNNANLFYNLANALNKSRKADEAISNYINAIRLKPDFTAAYNNLGNTLKEQGKFDEAISFFEKAMQLNPNNPEVYVSLGNILKDQGKINEAEKYYKHACQINSNIMLPYESFLFAMNYNPRHDPQSILDEHIRFAKQFAEPLYPNIYPHKNEHSSRRKLRIGYVSPDFRKHSVAYFIEPVLIAHNRDQFEVFCYSDVVFPDELTKRFQAHVDNWRNILGMSDALVTELINTDQIDILIDLAGHTDGNRFLLFARKPAPIQVSWIGYPATTGLPTIDYKVVDSYTDPPIMTDQFYTEKLIRMPESFLCYLPCKDSPEINNLPALQAGHITFGSFNNFAKLSTDIISLWIMILRQIPDAHLIIKAGSLSDKMTHQHAMNMFTKEGILEERIELMPFKQSLKEHLDTYNRVDIGIDTFPYNGTTTTCEALWMGVPVITLAGIAHASRVGMSLLSNIGLKEFTAKTSDEYVEIAVSLAKDLRRLQSLRLSLRDMMKSSPLCDAKRFTANLEKCYRQIWNTWCKSV